MRKFWDWYMKFHASFHDSETIFIARVKLFLGMTFTAVQQSGVDLAGFVENPKYQIALRVFFAWLIVDGTLTEWARRRRAEDLDVPPTPPLPTLPGPKT